jgi:oligoribonuclease
VTDKETVPTKLLWLDLEMTGLNPAEDFILEVAAEVTDFDLKTLADYDSRVLGGAPQAVAERLRANAWWDDFPANRDDFLGKLDQAKPLGAVEADLTGLVGAQFGNEPAVLAGNSIYNDRGFVKQYWPRLDAKLHYRMLDVSALKILMQGKYHVIYKKQKTHRARNDIQESIAELRHYLGYFRHDAQTG